MITSFRPLANSNRRARPEPVGDGRTVVSAVTGPAGGVRSSDTVLLTSVQGFAGEATPFVQAARSEAFDVFSEAPATAPSLTREARSAEAEALTWSAVTSARKAETISSCCVSSSIGSR